MSDSGINDSSLLYETGMRARKEVMGEAHVGQAMAQRTEFDAPFQDFITEVAWGRLWAGDALDRRTRSLVTIGILAAIGRREELALHLAATRRTGASEGEVREALLHVAVYAGVPAANAAFAVAREVFAFAGKETADGATP
jgi:4-carboxymuconolactone decarboxylase